MDISRTLVVAELSANHVGDLRLAKKSIRAMKDCGADAVKLQTYTADTMTIPSDRREFRSATQGTPWEGKGLYELYQEAHTPWEWHGELKQLAESMGLIFFSAPFDPAAVDFLDDLGVPMFKIASFEITDVPLIEYAAARGKPMVISTGVATVSDIQDAVEACRRKGNEDITLLQCTSSYPAPVEMANLRMIPNLAETFGVKSGLSDHTPGSVVASAAVALGAVMVEKHFILDRSIGGPDASFSLEPEQFMRLVEDIRTVERALGKVDYTLAEEKIAARRFARSLFVVEDIRAGDTLTGENIRSIRPGDGIAPKYLATVIGRTAVRDLRRGEPLNWTMMK